MSFTGYKGLGKGESILASRKSDRYEVSIIIPEKKGKHGEIVHFIGPVFWSVGRSKGWHTFSEGARKEHKLRRDAVQYLINQDRKKRLNKR